MTMYDIITGRGRWRVREGKETGRQAGSKEEERGGEGGRERGREGGRERGGERLLVQTWRVGAAHLTQSRRGEGSVVAE